MRPLPNRLTMLAQLTQVDAPNLPAEPPTERRRHEPPPGVEPDGGRYIPLKLRVAFTFVAGLLWLCFSLWLSRTWIRTHSHNRPDRKSTRLNSSHVSISYAVFCLKKKK